MKCRILDLKKKSKKIFITESFFLFIIKLTCLLNYCCTNINNYLSLKTFYYQHPKYLEHNINRTKHILIKTYDNVYLNIENTKNLLNFIFILEKKKLDIEYILLKNFSNTNFVPLPFYGYHQLCKYENMKYSSKKNRLLIYNIYLKFKSYLHEEVEFYLQMLQNINNAYNEIYREYYSIVEVNNILYRRQINKIFYLCYLFNVNSHYLPTI